ncbi:MAG: phosphate signaling complex protein PhoU [Desulfosudaceae bacterium]
MTTHLFKELEYIKRRLLELGAMTEDRLNKAIQVVRDYDKQLAQEIIDTDYEIDNLEVEIEEECLKGIALHQPVAGDLRFLAVTLKINNDLERIADEAVNIAQRVMTIAKKDESFTYDYIPMGNKVKGMLKKSLNAFVDRDPAAAKEVLFADDEVDLLRNETYDELKEASCGTIHSMAYLLNLFLISRHLERVADHATNIAEEVIYMVEGEIVRHADKKSIELTIADGK